MVKAVRIDSSCPTHSRMEMGAKRAGQLTDPLDRRIPPLASRTPSVL
jgi:hypothetical protein